LTYEGVPGLVETTTALGETTLIVDPARLREACFHLRDDEGFNVLADVTAVDYLGWPTTKDRVAGYKGTAAGRDINAPGSWGLAWLP
jgi:NADH:ubiquinone oxidoreductase subunit C